MSDVSVLPSAMQARREQLLQQQNTIENQPQPPAEPVDPPAQPVVSDNDEVTLTRAELNKLQASADLSERNARLAEQARLDLEEAQARLTAAQEPSKATPSPAPATPSSPAYTLEAGTDLTEAEREAYDEDAIRVITKVVRAELNRVIPKLEEALSGRITSVEGYVKEATGNINSNIRKQTAKQFNEKIRANVDDVNKIIEHADWPAFLESRQPTSGFIYKQVFVTAFEDQNLDVIKGIFEDFRKKYIGPSVANKDGYASVPSSSSSTPAPQSNSSNEKLKMSDRRKAQKDFISKKITVEQLDVIKAQFDKAEQEGRIIYD